MLFLLLIKLTLLLWLFCVISLKDNIVYTLGDGEDNRPGMRGGHQMVIDVQSGEEYLQWKANSFKNYAF